jgi:hypothetical protein
VRCLRTLPGSGTARRHITGSVQCDRPDARARRWPKSVGSLAYGQNYRSGMEYEVKSLSQFGVSLTPLGLQGFLNGWVIGNGFEVVTAFTAGDDWIIIVKK